MRASVLRPLCQRQVTSSTSQSLAEFSYHTNCWYNSSPYMVGQMAIKRTITQKLSFNWMLWTMSQTQTVNFFSCLLGPQYKLSYELLKLTDKYYLVCFMSYPHVIIFFCCCCCCFLAIKCRDQRQEIPLLIQGEMFIQLCSACAPQLKGQLKS